MSKNQDGKWRLPSNEEVSTSASYCNGFPKFIWNADALEDSMGSMPFPTFPCHFSLVLSQNSPHWWHNSRQRSRLPFPREDQNSQLNRPWKWVEPSFMEEYSGGSSSNPSLISLTMETWILDLAYYQDT